MSTFRTKFTLHGTTSNSESTKSTIDNFAIIDYIKIKFPHLVLPIMLTLQLFNLMETR